MEMVRRWPKATRVVLQGITELRHPVTPWKGEKTAVGAPVFGAVSVLPGPPSVNTPRNAIDTCAQDFPLRQKRTPPTH